MGAILVFLLGQYYYLIKVCMQLYQLCGNYKDILVVQCI